jgi:hypothetical protein
MSDSNTSTPPTTRVTLKLKAGVRKAPPERKPEPVQRPQQQNTKSKPGAHWSDEYKERMQADMDALASR